MKIKIVKIHNESGAFASTFKEGQIIDSWELENACWITDKYVNDLELINEIMGYDIAYFAVAEEWECFTRVTKKRLEHYGATLNFINIEEGYIIVSLYEFNHIEVGQIKNIIDLTIENSGIDNYFNIKGIKIEI